MLKHFKTYYFSVFLLLSIIAGGFVGSYFGKDAIRLKPLGDIFLNLIFTTVVPLIFFSISSSVARIGESKQIGKLMFCMLMIFLMTGMIAAIFMLIVVLLFPPAQNIILNPLLTEPFKQIHFQDQIVNIFTVSDFTQLFSHQHMLALIFFAMLVGLSASHAGEKGKPFVAFLESGTDIFMRVISYIMYYAPIGFFAYFAVLVAKLGPQLVENYLRATIIYYASASFYFVIALTAYAYLAGKKESVKLFWNNALLPMITSVATCSSAASIPANLQATKNMGISENIYKTVIPLGSILHKDGSVLGAIIKISFLFGIFHMSFTAPIVLLTALLIALLVGTVMGAIPSGGMLGEMLILSFYGFPPEALMVIAAISIIIDPLATMLNVVSNTVCTMLIACLMEGKTWLSPKWKNLALGTNRDIEVY